MFCRKCGEQLSDSMEICPRCGAPVAAVSNEGDAVGPEIIPQADPVPRKKHTLRTVLIIAGCVAAVGAALAFVLINAELNERYQYACDLMDAGDTSEAKAVFAQLGAFEDAKDLVQECQNLIDYNAAKQKLDDGSYEEAKQAFAALGSFEDANKMVQECQNAKEYNEASSLKESGELASAKDLFLSLGSYEDAKEQALECQNQMDYDKAMGLMDEGFYQDAKAIFDELDPFSDAHTYSLRCQEYIDYAIADAYYNNGEYYKAYRIFLPMFEFLDAGDRAMDCFQPNPDNGELYRNPDFGKKSCAVTIKVGGTEESLYLKVYTPDDVLVSTVFVAAGKKTKIKLPTGSYRMKAAYGVDWFGETDMFGDDGYYEVLIFEDGTDIDTLSSKYIYTLSFLQQEDGNIGGMNVGAEDF